MRLVTPVYVPSVRRVRRSFKEHHVALLSGEGAWLQPKLTSGSIPERDSSPSPADYGSGFPKPGMPGSTPGEGT